MVALGLSGLAPGDEMANPYSVDFGNIPFSGAPGAMFGLMGGTPDQAMAALGPAYQSSYNAALDFNKGLGTTINTGYNRAMEQQLAAQQEIMSGLDGYGESSRRDIAGANTKQQGDMMQSMISRGLGNTTVMDSGKRGLNDDLARQNLQLDDQLAAMRANLRSQFSQQNTMLAQNQLGWLNSMTGQYPNAGLYGQLAAQFGAQRQSAANQAALQDALGRGRQQGIGAAPPGISGGGGGQRQRAYAPLVGAPPVGDGGGGGRAPASRGNGYPQGWFDSLVPASDYYTGQETPWYDLNDLYGSDVGGANDFGYYGDLYGSDDFGNSLNDLYGSDVWGNGSDSSWLGGAWDALANSPTADDWRDYSWLGGDSGGGSDSSWLGGGGWGEY